MTTNNIGSRSYTLYKKEDKEDEKYQGWGKRNKSNKKSNNKKSDPPNISYPLSEEDKAIYGPVLLLFSVHGDLSRWRPAYG